MYSNYPSYYQPFQNNYSQPMSNPDERIWVQGEDAARAYLVTANAFVRLWDSTAPVFYEKRADNTGRPYMEVYEYKKREFTPKTENLEQNDLKCEIEALRERIERLEKNETE